MSFGRRDPALALPAGRSGGRGAKPARTVRPGMLKACGAYLAALAVWNLVFLTWAQAVGRIDFQTPVAAFFALLLGAGLPAMAYFALSVSIGDWLMRKAKVAHPLAYALLGLGAPLLIWIAMLSAMGTPMTPVQLFMVAPAGLVGGWVLGRSRVA